MKSFKQLIDEAKFEVELSKDDGWATVINKDDVLELVEQWLTQKLQEVSKFTQPTEYHTYTELLEELKQ